VELQDVLRVAGTCRYYLPDSVDDAQLARVLDAARFAPQGGNRQPVRFVVVRDPAAKAALRDWYLEPWAAYVDNVQSGAVAVGGERARRAVADADHMARGLAEIPVLIVVCAVLAELHITDANLGRVPIVGGASVYPAVQNLLLSAREEGLGAALTTLLCADEERVCELLAIPEGVAVAAVVALGHPARPLARSLSRRPLAEIAYGERWGQALPGA
jgi:nitroreductase